MSANLTPQEFIERERARLEQEAAAKAIEAAQAAAKLEEYKRKTTELYRLAAELNLGVTVPTVDAAGSAQEQHPTLPAKLEHAVQQVAPIAERSVESSQVHSGLTSLSALIDSYCTDERSPYKKIGFSTRKYYTTCIKNLSKGGDVALADLNKASIQKLWDAWTDNGTKRLPMGHALITMLRGLINYGHKILDDPNCERVAFVLHQMQFPIGMARTEKLTAEYVDAVIKVAHQQEKPSIALAQALQFDCSLRQKLVIGEWVPISENAISTVLFEDKKWLRGLRWEEIDGGLVLKRSATSTDSAFEFNLKQSPRVMAEFERLGNLPSSGPMIVCETTGRPWIANEFRRWWRKIAREAGVPDNVRNMDSRFGEDERPKLRDVRMRSRRKILEAPGGASKT